MAVPLLHIGFFYQINLFKQAIKYDSFIHNYENEIYKNSSDYFIELVWTLYLKEKDTYKLVRNPYTRAVSSFFSLIAPPYIENPAWNPIRNFYYGNQFCNKPISFKIFLYYLKAQMMDLEQVDPHLMQSSMNQVRMSLLQSISTLKISLLKLFASNKYIN